MLQDQLNNSKTIARYRFSTAFLLYLIVKLSFLLKTGGIDSIEGQL